MHHELRRCSQSELLEYREFKPDDEESCRSLILSCLNDMAGLSPAAREKLARKVEHHSYADQLADAFCVVCASRGEVVGMGALIGNTVNRMYVRSDYRQQGVGRTIHGIIEAHAKEQGLHVLELESSLNALGFYVRLGYQQVCQKQGLLDGAEILNAVMRKELR